MSLKTVLPNPVNKVYDRDDEQSTIKVNLGALQHAKNSAPPYGSRRGFIPRNETDYGDGGAFPEIHVAQYPLDMARPNSGGKKSTALALQTDASGKVKYDIIAKQGHAKDKIVYSNINQLLPAEVLSENAEELQRPNDEEIADITETTRKALEKLTNAKIAAALPVRAAEKQGAAQYIRYKPSQQSMQFNSGAKERIIRMVEAQVDPMEPPKFKINKKIPRAPPSPPAPVLHSPSRKVSVKEQKEWKVPPCISNWKNAKGYTIPLDKRLAADGRGLQQVHINEKFAKMAEALYIADRKAREAVEARAQLEKKLAQKEKEKKEEQLRAMAQRAREERAGLSRYAQNEGETTTEVRERDEIREQRHRERARDRNLQRAAPDKRTKHQKERERDISEQIALGMPGKTQFSGEGQFDSRLFNTTKGMDSGYGDDEAYNVYDKPWRESGSLASHLYRPSKQVDQDIYGGDLDKIVNTSRFVPDKEFSGTDRKNPRSGPVQFEKEDDIFQLDKFLDTAKTGSKRKDEASSSKSSEHSEKKRRRD
jgi:SNW domain-containing protein 1